MHSHRRSPVSISVRLADRAGLLAVLIVGVTAAGPSVAPASVVAVDGALVRYAAGAGEANQVTVTAAADEHTTHIVDLGATIEPGKGCQQVDPHAARCSTQGVSDFLNIEVDAGDLNDTVNLSVSSVFTGVLAADLGLRADGATGDDVLRIADALGDSPYGIGLLNGEPATTNSGAAPETMRWTAAGAAMSSTAVVATTDSPTATRRERPMRPRPGLTFSTGAAAESTPGRPARRPGTS